jgi:hypothetical protein
VSTVPLRLVVISARVPEGERCNGCTWEPDPLSTLCKLHGGSVGIAAEGTILLRHKACRERDGWVAYPPGSAVVELVEAVKRRNQAADELGEPVISEYGWDMQWMDRKLRLNAAELELREAARKVAVEAK